MFNLSVLFLGLLVVVTYAAPIDLDEVNTMIDENGSQKFRSGTDKRDSIEDIPFTWAAAGNRIPPWKKGDTEPTPPPMSASKQMTTEDKIIVDANENRATGDHLPTPPPMPEHKLKYQMKSAEGSNSFSGNFESEDGIKMEESGKQKRQVGPKPNDIGTVFRGSYSFTSPDGGFQATGDHLPTPPPMPEHRLIFESGSQKQIAPEPEDN